MATSQIQIQSYNQFLGAMIRSIIANTPLNDINQGSVLLTILEAAAANDFENNAAILSLLNLLNISTVQGVDLDNRAADYGLTRLPATKATGSISIFNTSITKQSTNLYILKPAPIAGQTVLYVNNTTGWATSGTLYVGRGSISFEGPIPYSSITVYPTFSQINLSTALQNNHLISDTVINAQGQLDQNIAAGTIVSIPANNQNPEIDYVTLRDAVLPAGETEIDGVTAIALVAGSIGNAPINSITEFSASPFTGAAVENISSFTGGTDQETDQELRDRIQSYTNTLARGTAAAILAAVIGVSDSSDSKQVASAVITEPPSLGQPSILYIDDGTGFQPTYAGQSVDTLLINASGKEQFLQLANFPVTRPQVVNAAIGPFNLINGSSLSVSVDGVEETIIFHTSDFVNISSAQVGEIVVAINNQAKNFSARLTNDSANILLYPDVWNAETIQVAALQPSNVVALYANNELQFPTSEFSFIALYQNSNRLREQTKGAEVQTAAFGSWNINIPGDLVISVDGTPEQDRSFSLNNFPGASTFASLTLDDWVTAFNQQFAGITAVATADQTMQISSNQSGSNSSITILGGSYLAQLFPTQSTTSIGQTGQFILNRQTGNLEILTTINPGDNITAGSADNRGYVISTVTATGNYNVSTDSVGRAAQMIMVADSTYCTQRALNDATGSTITISNPSANVMRIMSNLLTCFPALLPGDFVYITQRSSGWLNANNTGLFKVVDKGFHTTAGVDTYIDVLNAGNAATPSITPQVVSVADPADIQAFTTNGYPQLWLGSFTPTPAVASLNDIVNSINNNIINVEAEVYESNSIRITSTTQQSGSIAIPVVMGTNAIALFTSTKTAQFGNSPLVASIVSSKSLLTHFKIDPPTNLNTWLNRQTFDDSKGALTVNAIPDVPPYSAAYSEILQSTGVLNTTHVDFDSIISFTDGNNKDQLRSIAAFNPNSTTDSVGTQEALARTSLDNITGDQFEIVRPLQLSASDSVAVIIDQNPQNNTINIPLARTGQVNSGDPGGGGTFIPTSTEFSANDYDNQPGIDFSNQNVWGTTINNTNFSDYATWFMARNWYASGGVGSGSGAMLIRSDEYGPNGNFLRFSMQYPSIANQTATTLFVNTPSYTTLSYYFGSGAAIGTALSAGNTISVDGPYPNATTNFPNGSISSGNYWDYTFNEGSLASVIVGNILSILPSSGVSTANQGIFSVQNISGNTVRVYNPSGVATIPGESAVYTVTTVADTNGSLNGTYFVVYDTNGSVVIWINEGTAIQPVVAGAGRYLEVNAPLVPATSILGTAANYGLLAYSAITNTGSSVVTGDIGVSPAGAITGFPPGTVTGTTDINDSASAAARASATSAYTTLSTMSSTAISSTLDGQTLTPGVYSEASGTFNLAASGPGTLTLNGSGQYVFICSSTLVTGAGGTATIALTNGATAANIFWVVGSSATINSGSPGTFNGNIIAQASVTNTLGGTVNGSLIALNGAVTLSAAANVNTQSVLGLSAAAVAADIVAAITGDSALTASASSNVVTITDIKKALLPDGSDGTSGFTVTSPVPNGINTSLETIVNPANISAFPLTGTTVTSISATINAGTLMSATPVGSGSLTITKSTQEETSATLAYGYTPGNAYVSIYDGVNWVKSFENPNPNFTLKTPFVLQGAQPSIYSMDTAPNSSGIANGELFKLIPITVQNLYHQFTQPALSQLPIVATVSITDDRRNVQIQSMQLGSAGAVEVLGGTGNQSQMFLESSAVVETDNTGSYLRVQVPAFPETYSVGDTVLLQNEAGVTRLNRLQSSDTITTVNINPTTNAIEYAYNPKDTGIVSGTSFTVTDVGSTYSPPWPAGFIWRWTAVGSGVTFATVNPGDLLYAFGSLSGWAQQNQARPSGDGAVSGLPIIAVNIATPSIDVINPFGVAMSSTTVGSGTVQICPTPSIQWTLAHAAYIDVATLSSVSNLVTINTASPHFLNTGNTISLRDSTNVPDGTYTVTVLSPVQLTFTYSGPNFNEVPTYASLIRSSLTQSRYRIQSLGFNNLMRLNRSNGQSPSFIDCGVAVDDYISLSGTTFASNNNGLFRVLAVDNDSIIFLNSEGTDQISTLRPMNNQNIEVVFTANANYVTGPAGAFKYVLVGDWVKKQTDPDTDYLQVISLNNANAALATQINLGGNYGGSTDTSVGVIYRESTDYDQGVFLQNAADISIYEGDSVTIGDTLYVQDIVEPGWFNVNNTGNYTIVQYGTEANYTPFLRVINPAAVVSNTGDMSVSPGGFYIIESLANKFYTIREVRYAVLDSANSAYRDIFVTPWSRSYKFTVNNNSSITHLGKLGYSNNIVIGIDGYTYYTGLLQTVQRIVDGFEPDAADYPGQRAVGSAIETLPPLPYQVNIALTVITNAGVNLGDVSDSIKSTIINYIEGLAVGAPIVLSQIIADIQPINGVASVVFTNPAPSTQSITLAANEKAIITANNISIA